MSSASASAWFACALYDDNTGQRLKTVEFVEWIPWQPRARGPRRREDEIVAVQIAFYETELRERAKHLGAMWRPAQKLSDLG